MSLWETLTAWDERDRRQQFYVQIDPANVHPRLEDRKLVAGGSFVRMRVASMVLRRETLREKRWCPAVHSLVRFESNGRTVELPGIADTAQIALRENEQGDAVVRDFVLTPPVPFNGGELSLSAGLLALEGGDTISAALGALGDSSKRLRAGQFASSLRVAEPLARGIQVVCGAGRGRVHLGFRDSNVAGSLRNGYIAMVRPGGAALDPSSLHVKDGELYVDAGGGVLKPLVGPDYMLLRLEIVEHVDPDDLNKLDSIQRPYREAIAALRAGKESYAAARMRTALRRARAAPELTYAYRNEVFDRLFKDFKEVAEDFRTSNLKEERPAELAQVMLGRFNVKKALKRGVPALVKINDLIQQPAGAAEGTDADTRAEVDAAAGAAPAFYFALVGEAVEGDAVRCGTDADLVFNYDPPPPEALAALKGKDIEEVRTQGGELGVSVIPVGLTVRDQRWHQVATFENGRIKEPLTFRLRASDVPRDDALLHVIFDKKGRIIYEFDLRVRCVAELGPPAPFGERLPLDDLDLDDLAARHDGKDRTPTLFIRSDKESLTAAYFTGDDNDDLMTLPWLTVTRLANIIEKMPKELLPASGHAIWTQAVDPLSAPLTQSRIKAYRECRRHVVSAGSTMREGLWKDEKLKVILEKINALPPGSSLRFKTDCAFLPWEMYYPHDYHHDRDDSSIQPQELWGARFSIECLLLGGAGGGYKLPMERHRTTPASVSFNVNPNIDTQVSQSDYKPVAAQVEAAKRGFAGGAVKSDPNDSGEKIRGMLNSKENASTLIYFYCHGSSEGPLTDRMEKLEIDSKVYIEPGSLDTDVKYSAGPLIFLNSCSSAAVSPLSFSSFLSRFKEKQSLGLIGTSVAVPVTFGAGFGLALIEEYLGGAGKGVTIGEAMRTLRLRLLADGNPLGLFYTLQCPTEATALVVSAPGADLNPQPGAAGEEEEG